MIQLQYWNGVEWTNVGEPWVHEFIAWISLGGDDLNYRTIEIETGKVLTSKQYIQGIDYSNGEDFGCKVEGYLDEKGVRYITDVKYL
ncbi:MAG TPA: hypothetical protein VFC79_02580 [Tissierellaceae bacterium]|nr:hypothetical protein [Tissierellaceae bacterium]